MLVFSLMIIARIFYIQHKQGDKLRAMAQTQELRMADLIASRGNILTSNGNMLAASVPVFELRMDMTLQTITNEIFNTKVDSLADGFAKILGNQTKIQYKSGLIKARQENNRYFLIARKATYEQLKAVRKLPIVRMGRFKGGLIAEQSTQRVLPYGNLAQRTIGYEIKEENLFVGLEGAYSEALTGKDGKQLQRRINAGDWIPIHDESEIEPKNGLDIVTTIDINLQDLAENALLRLLQENEANMGCVIVMEVETGYIKAIANLKLNQKTGVYEESYNYSVAELIEPGSTFKLPNIMAAIEDGNVKLSDVIVTGNGNEVIHGMTVRDVHQIDDGVVTVREVFEHSSNVGMAKIINKCFENRPSLYIDRLYSMSLNKPLGIEIAGEGKPFIKHPSDKKLWWKTSLTALSFGYELQVTPLQILTFYNAVANDGVMMKPIFVQEIREGSIVKQKFDTIVLNPQIASPSTVATAKILLEGVVQNGTAKTIFKDSPYKVAGKTGTAKLVESGQYTKKYNASFVGYFPADNPKYSCIVVINRPNAGAIYGGVVAAPVFKEIADKVYATSISLDYEPLPDTNKVVYPVFAYPAMSAEISTIYTDLNIPVIGKTQKAEWAISEQKPFAIVVDTLAEPMFSMPDVLGMKPREAVYMIEKMGLRASLSGKGMVVEQSLPKGSAIIPGELINLKLAMKFEPINEDTTGHTVPGGRD
jgi:cell division protein FtsI (penicillin-binding protein 3)